MGKFHRKQFDHGRYLWNVLVSLIQTATVLSDLSPGLYHKS